MTNEYLGPEDQARQRIDEQLVEAGWVVQSRDALDVTAALGVALRDRRGVNDPDYLLFVEGRACGVIEAKKVGWTLSGVEVQSKNYLESVPDHVPTWTEPLRFAYESNSVEVQFTDWADPEPRSRRVFAVHHPETMLELLRDAARHPDAPTLRARLRQLPPIPADAPLWDHQRAALDEVEASLAADRPRTLLQMATGAGKTYTAANLAYRLAKHAGVRRVLFLVDRNNLGKQATNEFEQFFTPEEKRKLAELYGIQRLTGGPVREDAKIVVSTIQGVYAALTRIEMPEETDGEPTDGPPVEVTYSPALPPETFDVIIIDEAHRSIYGRWKPVLEYFDAHLIGLTATPTKRTFGFFNKNLVYEYSHEKAVADDVNVAFEVYRIRTEIGQHGSTVDKGTYATFRDRATRRTHLEQLDDDVEYDPDELDRRVVATDQIRTVITHFRDHLFKPYSENGIFPGRSVVPKTLIFAKDDSHAEDIVHAVRQVFDKGNDFCVKITSKSTGGTAEDLLNAFRNSFNPRIAVTVDLIATGTDVKAIECVMFMRAVKSRSYFEQMKGRGSRVIPDADFQTVTNDPAAPTKTHFVIVDAVGVTDTEQQDTVPLERKRYDSLKKLFDRVGFNAASVDDVSSIASRLARLNRELTRTERAEIVDASGGTDLGEVISKLMDIVDPDRREALAEAHARAEHGDDPTPEQVEAAKAAVLSVATAGLRANPGLRKKILEIHRSHSQLIDDVSLDTVAEAGFSQDATERARGVITSFREYIAEHRDEIDALQVLYSDHRPDVLDHLEQLVEAISRPPYRLSPEAVWSAYDRLERSRVKGSLRSKTADLLALLRFELGLDQELEPFAEVVEWRWKEWLSEQDAQARFTDEQRAWLELMKDVVAENVGISDIDFELGELASRGGLGRAHADFDGQLRDVMDELNEALTP